MICRSCDASNPPGEQTCRRCMSMLEPSCSACGARLPDFETELCVTCRTEQSPEPMDADELFPAPPDDITTTTSTRFSLEPRYTGRRRARERLEKAFRDTRDLGELAFLVLIGEPGMGKSRTATEFRDKAVEIDEKASFLTGAGDGSGQSYAAFARLLCERFRVGPSDAVEDVQEKVLAGVAEVLPAARVTEVGHLIAHLMRVPFADSPVVAPLAETPQQLEARIFIALKRLLQADAGRGPLVLCFENLELCGPETVNLLHYLAAGLASAPVVLLGTARTSLFERHPSFGEGEVPLQRIDLGPLDEEESTELLRELCRPLDEVPEALVEHASRLGGSPRALYELIRLLLESEVITRKGTGWRIDGERLEEIGLPASHEDLVAERVRIMEGRDRDILEKAAAIGETCWLDSIVALLRTSDVAAPDPDGPTLGDIAAAGDHTRVKVAQTLARLVDREWLIEVDGSTVPGEREYRFAYPYLWSAVYEGIDEVRRRRFHKIVAQWLELRPEGRAALAQEDIGRHLELAGDARGAAGRYRRAADAARKNFFNDRAIRLYAHALECLGEHDHAARIHLWHDLGSVYELTGDYEAALGAFERMLRLAWVVASRTKAAVAFNKMGRVWRRKGDLRLALEYLERGEDLFEQAGDARGIAGSLDDIGAVLYLLGRYDEAYEKVTQGLARRGKRGDKRSIAHSLSNLGNIQKDRGRFAEALNCHNEALELRRQIRDRAGVVASLNNLAVLAYEHGDHRDARRGWEQALSEAEEIGALPLQALALSNLGELALVEERLEEARRRLADGLELAEDIDDRRLQVEATRNLALLEHAAGDSARARELAHHAHEIAASAGLRECEGRALLSLGEVFGGTLFDAERTQESPKDGESPPAEDYFRRGLELLRAIGNESELARGLERFGRYKIEHGDLESGKAMLVEALAIFNRLGMRQGSEVEKVLSAV